jgi:putative membrane protein insertion efficiency factor
VIGLRRALWIAGAPARGALLGLIGLYRATFSGAFAGQCRFSPGCSRYAAEAIRTRGAFVGSALAVRRVLRCNPFGKGGLDPVPPRRASDRAYDGIVQEVSPGR